MKRVWTARGFAAVLGGSLLYFLITVLVMMCGSFSPCSGFFSRPLPPPCRGGCICIWRPERPALGYRHS